MAAGPPALVATMPVMRTLSGEATSRRIAVSGWMRTFGSARRRWRTTLSMSGREARDASGAFWLEDIAASHEHAAFGGGRAVLHEVLGEAGEVALNDLLTGREEDVEMAALRHAAAMSGAVREAVLFEDENLIEAVREDTRGEQAAHAGADDDGPSRVGCGVHDACLPCTRGGDCES